MTTAATKPIPPDNRLDGPIHDWFGLTYSNYQVLHRTLMQSMPVEWQQRMVACLDELRSAFAHIEHADYYKVDAADEAYYSDLDDWQMKQLGISRPDGGDDDETDESEDADSDVFYDRDGNEHQGHDRLLIPRIGGDPIPHYNRGRTYIEPRIGG